jgi:excisionase family DNA binding protein
MTPITSGARSAVADGPARLLTVADAAELLRVAPATVRSLVKGGGLRASRVGQQLRIRGEALEQWLAANEVAAVGRELRADNGTAPDHEQEAER